MATLVKPSKEKEVLVLDHSCTHACPHCFLGSHSQPSFEQTKNVAQQADDLGYRVYFYAAEVNPKSFDMYRLIGQDEHDSSICLRGEVALRNLSWLRKKKGRIGLSLHGAQEKTHRLLAGKNSFAQTLEAITYIKAHNTEARVNIWSVVHKKNMYEMKAVCELARDLGVDDLNFIKLSYLGRAKHLDESWFLNVHDVKHVLDIMHSLYASESFPHPHISLSPNWGLNTRQAQKFRSSQKLPYSPAERYCPAGIQYFTVDASTLQVYPCHVLAADNHFVIGFWSSQGIVIEHDAFMRASECVDEPCGSCDLFSVCGGGCRAEAIAEHVRLTGEYRFHVGFHYCRKQIEDEYG